MAVPTTRGRAIQRATDARRLYQRLVQEYDDVIPAGQVLASVVRIAHRLEQRGCPPALISSATERAVRLLFADLGVGDRIRVPGSGDGVVVVLDPEVPVGNTLPRSAA